MTMPEVFKVIEEEMRSYPEASVALHALSRLRNRLVYTVALEGPNEYGVVPLWKLMRPELETGGVIMMSVEQMFAERNQNDYLLHGKVLHLMAVDDSRVILVAEVYTGTWWPTVRAGTRLHMSRKGKNKWQAVEVF